jgi:hypothetical protein
MKARSGLSQGLDRGAQIAPAYEKLVEARTLVALGERLKQPFMYFLRTQLAALGFGEIDGHKLRERQRGKIDRAHP